MKKLAFLGLLALAVAAPSVLLLAQNSPDQVAIAAAQPTAVQRGSALGADIALVARGVSLDTLGQAHVRYQETYRNIPVFEGEAIVHVDLASRAVVDVTDALLTVGALDTRPGLSEAAARGRAL